MKDTNNLYTRESPGQFDDPEAEVVRQNIINQADGQHNLMIPENKLNQMLF